MKKPAASGLGTLGRPDYSWGRNAPRNSAVLSAGRQVAVTGAETPEVLTGTLTAGAVAAVPLLLQALKPSAKARLAIPIHAVFFIFESPGSAHKRAATGGRC